MENEVWKDIKDYEGFYQISNFGRVKSLLRKINYINGSICIYKERILLFDNAKSNKLNQCYKRVTLSKNNVPKRFQVHRLVGIYFLENPLNKPCVNHIDGNPSNNNFLNLEWCTHSENELHSYNVLKKINSIRKLTNENVKYIRENFILGRNGNTIKLAKAFNVSLNTILNIIKNRYYV